MAISVIAHYTQVVEITRQLELARSELDALQEEGKHLKLEIASLNSPERLKKEAYELGMQYPGREQMIILTAGASKISRSFCMIKLDRGSTPGGLAFEQV